MADNTLLFSHRIMLDLVSVYLAFDIRMASETDLSRFILDEIGLIGCVCAVTDEAFAFSKR